MSKNIIIAATLLVIIVLVVFLFSSKIKTGDLAIPSQIPLGSPLIDFMVPSSTESANTEPFKILTKEEIAGKKVLIETVKGNISIVLLENAPLASSNFIDLVSKKFYDGLVFHRREENFVVQGGDPKGDGTGGPGYSFADEQVLGEYLRGTVAMANAGPNTNGSQFFIMLSDNLTLPKKYTIFGQVVSGMEVVDKIQVGDKMENVTLE